MKQLHTITQPDNFDAPRGLVRSTCRLGPKWRDVEIGEQIELTIGPGDTDRNVIGKAVVLRVDYLAFHQLNHRTHVATNHSRNSRKDKEALFSAMKRAYGEKFTNTSAVNVLFYRRLS
jgi:hypothetical protein